MSSSTTVFIVAACMIFCVTPTLGQLCSGDTTFACVGLNNFQACIPDPLTGVSTVGGTVFSCITDNPDTTTPICNELVENNNLLPCEADNTPACSREGNFPVQGNCKRFYNCVFDGVTYKKVFRNCPGALEFNVLERRCNAAGGVAGTCGTNPTPAPTPTPNPMTPPVCTVPGRIADPTSCRHFYLCPFFLGGGQQGQNNRAERYRCPWELLFDTTWKICRPFAPCGTRPNNLL